MKRMAAFLVLGAGIFSANCTLDSKGEGLFPETGGNGGQADASVGGAGGGAAGQGGTAGDGGKAGQGGSSGAGGQAGGTGGAAAEAGSAGAGGAAGGSGQGGAGEGGSAGTATGGAGMGGEGGSAGTATGGAGMGGEGGSAGTATGGAGMGGEGGSAGTATGGSAGQGGSAGTAGNAGAAGVDAGACNLSAIPAPTSFPLDSHVTNVRINGGGEIANDVAPGSSVSVLYDFQIKNSDPCYCPGCWQQVYVGLAGLATTTCSNQQRGCPGTAGTDKAVVFSAPTQPGTYYLSVAATWEYNCVATTPPTDPAAFVGAICVK